MADLQKALKEAYSQASTTEIIHHTLEIMHPAFVDEKGNATAVRVVRNYKSITARLEKGAPLNGGELVEFQPHSFDVDYPNVSSESVPRLTVSIDNVGGEIIKNIELACHSGDAIIMIYRAFISSDLETPQNNNPMSLVLSNVSATNQKITAVAMLKNLSNVSFPNKIYDIGVYDGLRLL